MHLLVQHTFLKSQVLAIGWHASQPVCATREVWILTGVNVPQGISFEAGKWLVDYCDLGSSKNQEKILKYWHLQHVRNHLDLPDATAEPAQAAAADNAADDAARLHKLMPHVTDVCNSIAATLLQSMSACDILEAPSQPLRICQEVVSLFQTSSSQALQTWANQAPANLSTFLASLSLQGYACTSPLAAVSYANYRRATEYDSTYHEDQLKQVMTCSQCRSGLRT